MQKQRENFFIFCFVLFVCLFVCLFVQAINTGASWSPESDLQKGVELVTLEHVGEELEVLLSSI